MYNLPVSVHITPAAADGGGASNKIAKVKMVRGERGEKEKRGLLLLYYSADSAQLEIYYCILSSI